jgi:hypothetical protein
MTSELNCVSNAIGSTIMIDKTQSDISQTNRRGCGSEIFHSYHQRFFRTLTILSSRLFNYLRPIFAGQPSVFFGQSMPRNPSYKNNLGEI